MLSGDVGRLDVSEPKDEAWFLVQASLQGERRLRHDPVLSHMWQRNSGSAHFWHFAALDNAYNRIFTRLQQLGVQLFANGEQSPQCYDRHNESFCLKFLYSVRFASRHLSALFCFPNPPSSPFFALPFFTPDSARRLIHFRGPPRARM